MGRLEENQVVEATGLGLAQVCNVVSIRNSKDLEQCLGPNLTGLGLDLPPNFSVVQSAQRLCDEVNMPPRLLEHGNLILFNLQFLTALEREDAIKFQELCSPEQRREYLLQ